MKGILNVLGVLISVALTFLIASLLYIFVILSNAKLFLNKDGITSLISKIDFMQVLKEADDQDAWEELLDVGQEVGLTKEQTEEILLSTELKNQISPIISEMINSIMEAKNYQISDKHTEELIKTVIEQYGKVTDIDISNDYKNRITEYIKEEVVKDINNALNENNIEEDLPDGFKDYYETLVTAINGPARIYIITIIAIVIGVIALARFSYYKWMPYFGTASIFASILVMETASIIKIINESDMKDVLAPITKELGKNLNISTITLFVLAVISFVAHHYLKNNALGKEPSLTDKAKEA